MNIAESVSRIADTSLEDFAAALSDAAYPVALRHGVRGSSIDLELDLWRVLNQTVDDLARAGRLCIAKGE